jgi:hypothetical protein
MTRINNLELSVHTDHLDTLASVTVTCDVEFTQFEVNAMERLGLEYRLHCQLFNKDLWDVEPVAILDDQVFPRPGYASVAHIEHVVFASDRPITDLHRHAFTQDQLIAEVRLVNEETGDETVSSTQAVRVNLEA